MKQKEITIIVILAFIFGITIFSIPNSTWYDKGGILPKALIGVGIICGLVAVIKIVIGIFNNK